MNRAEKPSQQEREQFVAEALALARNFLEISMTRKLPIGVILQAAMEVHRYAAQQLPKEAQGEISIAVAGYAGELLQGLSPLKPTQPSH